jgi:hypothetical protein
MPQSRGELRSSGIFKGLPLKMGPTDCSMITQNKLSPYNVDNTTPIHYLTQSFKNLFPNIHLKSVSSKEIKNIIKSLKPKNSLAYDGTSTKLLKISSPFIISPLTHICNRSIIFRHFSRPLEVCSSSAPI